MPGSTASRQLVNAYQIQHWLKFPDEDEYIRISGTPMNRGIQQFLDGMQLCKDAVLQKKDLDVEDIRDIFSDFYKQQILLNKDNALGRFIFHEYGVHLQPGDREQVEAQLPPEPTKQ